MSDDVLQILKSNGEKLDHLTGQVDFMAVNLMDHDERLKHMEDTMATKQGIRDIVHTLDQLVTLVQKKDQEQTMTIARIDRLEENIEKNTNDIILIKPLVGLG